MKKQENKEIGNLIKLLEERENEISDFQRKFSSIKQYESDLQAFLALKQLEKYVFLEEEFLQSLVDKHSIKQYSLIYQPNATLQNFVSNVVTFGKILIETKQHDTFLTTSKRKQAQMTVQEAKSKAIEDINLKLHMTINGTGNYVFGCCMLPDNRTIFINHYSKSLRILKKGGSFDCDFKTSHSTYDVECIYKDTLVETYGDSKSKCITIVDMKYKRVNKIIPLNSVAYSITGTDGGLFFYFGGEWEIQMINLQDETVHQVVRGEAIPGNGYVTTFSYNVYQTRPSKNTVICYDLTGNTQWTFKNDNVLKYPAGISVDKVGNVFVVGHLSNNVVVISGDGKRHREVLSSKDGLSNPWALHYNQFTDQLLVANVHSNAVIYDCV